MIELNRLKIAHRDIKPNNILLHITNKGQHIYKITDLGAAKNFESAALSTTVGTEEYLFPEIYARAFYNTGNMELTPGIDLWSIGVTLYHVATGKLPFRPYEGCRRDRDTM
jgi:TANK-binding kinase 1